MSGETVQRRSVGDLGPMHPDCQAGDPCPECEQPINIEPDWDGGPTPHCRGCDWTGWPADGEE